MYLKSKRTTRKPAARGVKRLAAIATADDCTAELIAEQTRLVVKRGDIHDAFDGPHPIQIGKLALADIGRTQYVNPFVALGRTNDVQKVKLWRRPFKVARQRSSLLRELGRAQDARNVQRCVHGPFIGARIAEPIWADVAVWDAVAACKCKPNFSSRSSPSMKRRISPECADNPQLLHFAKGF